jgi:hypothetical protein
MYFYVKIYYEKQFLLYSQIDLSRTINNNRIVHIQYGQSQKRGIRGVHKTYMKELTTR